MADQLRWAVDTLQNRLSLITSVLILWLVLVAGVGLGFLWRLFFESLDRTPLFYTFAIVALISAAVLIVSVAIFVMRARHIATLRRLERKLMNRPAEYTSLAFRPHDE